MKIKKDKLNIIVPIAKIDIDFQREFGNFKYYSKLGKQETIFSYSKKIFDKFNSKFNIKIHFITSEKIQKIYKIKYFINKIKYEKNTIVLKKDTKNLIETILQSKLLISNKNEKIIIFHPDSFCEIDIEKFCNISKKGYDGIQFGYDHFNPTDHLSSNTGRFLITKNQKIKKIYEKTKLGNHLLTCAGLHYFKDWNIFEHYAEKLLLRKKIKYKVTSEVYNLMIMQNLHIRYFQVSNFISFSNISSVNEFNFWNSYFKTKYSKLKKTFNINNIIPSAGSGRRHKQFKVAKPFIDISGKSMVSHAMESLPVSNNNYVLFRDHVATTYKNEINKIKNILKKKITIVRINKKTDGMARTCLFLEKHLDKDLPIIISSCDYKFLYNEKKLHALIKKEDPDSIIFTFRNYPDARIDPNSYAYVKVNKNRIVKIVEKKAISKTPHKDFAVTGVFYFKNWYLFKKAVDDMISNKNTVNGEYYVATAIQELVNKKNKILNFEIDKFISWSLPIHLKTYFFWEKIFKK
tara:strand:+ start:441 stop:1997 length:1557 start_codon:yes stop_codon:yes gene_type:complete